MRMRCAVVGRRRDDDGTVQSKANHLSPRPTPASPHPIFHLTFGPVTHVTRLAWPLSELPTLSAGTSPAPRPAFLSDGHGLAVQRYSAHILGHRRAR